MWILIPAKSATQAKSRLSPVLSTDKRALLARLLLARLLTVLTSLEQVTNVVVISADIELRAIANSFGYHSLPDPKPGLNASLEAGRQYAIAQGATSLLILPTDLPRLSKESLIHFLSHITSTESCIVIAHDQAKQGTNALFLRPPTAIPFHFGINSGPIHRQLAQQANIPIIEVHHPAIAFDLDLPDDWHELIS